MTKLIIRRHFGTDRWEVIERYGYRETLLAITETKAEAQDYARIRKARGF